VGREGSTVTVVVVGQMARLSDAPAAEFRDTVTTAVGLLGD
jgi:hypothetical protein